MNIPETTLSGAYWESLFASRPWGTYPPEELIRFIARSFRSMGDKSAVQVLEIGCGPGPNIWYLAREGFSVAGIDCSPTAIRQAQERLKREGLPSDPPRVDLRVGDFSRLPWENEYFDAVVDIEALYANTLDGIKASVTEVWRTLKPGGHFFGRMFGDATMGSKSGELVEPGTRRKPTEGPCAGNEIAHFFTREELQELFSDFSELSIDYLSRSDANGAVHIYEWLVRAKK